MDMTTKRYERQEIIKGWQQERISQGRVLVLGAGTTGNEVIKNLALLGVGYITIVDRDVIEEVNLSRCVLFRDGDVGQPKAAVAAQRALELNPSISVRSWQADIVYDIGSLEYKGYDCVILTVDNLRARMWVNRYCWQNQIPLIDTGIEGWVGNVFVMTPPFESCVECGWTGREYQRLSEEHSCSKIGLDWAERKIPMVITSAAIAAGIAVQEAVKILLQVGDVHGLHNVYWFDGEIGALLTWKQPPKQNCAHNEYVPVTESSIALHVCLDETVEDIKEKVKDYMKCAIVEIKHDREIIYSAICRNCGYKQPIQPTFIGKYRRFSCPQCGLLETVPDEITEELKEGYTLRQLGIPANHLLTVIYDKGSGVGKAFIATKKT